ncbi:MAG: urease accessory protein UreD [Campylobacteraceae bacterium]|jgi:urease accessory protein|nr:urease accessory protein UreD [Campylobacteraceae bacterium]
MSLKLYIKNNDVTLKKLTLPSRYYLFKESENYIKLLTVGEGLFPNDKIHTNIDMDGSNLILASESAMKIYPSKGKFAASRYVFNLQRSNLEFLNDEIIMFKDSRFLQLFSIKFDENSTFFYTDMFSAGRSFEEYDFSEFAMRNRFIYDKNTEYLEEFKISGHELKTYLKNCKAQKKLFAKIYTRTKNNNAFSEELLKIGIKSFEKTQNEAILICIVLGNKISQIKSAVSLVWELYRKMLGKSAFDLGKR